MEILLVYGLVIAGLFYLMVFRPRNRAMRTHQAMMRSLQEGDMVVTSSGIHGAVALVDESEKVVWLEVAPEVELKVSSSAISMRLSGEDPEPEDPEPEDDEGETF